jgi:hypothetical protein
VGGSDADILVEGRRICCRQSLKVTVTEGSNELKVRTIEGDMMEVGTEGPKLISYLAYLSR